MTGNAHISCILGGFSSVFSKSTFSNSLAFRWHQWSLFYRSHQRKRHGSRRWNSGIETHTQVFDEKIKVQGMQVLPWGLTIGSDLSSALLCRLIILCEDENVTIFLWITPALNNMSVTLKMNWYRLNSSLLLYCFVCAGMRCRPIKKRDFANNLPSRRELISRLPPRQTQLIWNSLPPAPSPPLLPIQKFGPRP